MNLPEFLKSLLYEGRVRVQKVIDPHGRLIMADDSELVEAESFLTAFELEYRTELPYEPPPVSRRSMLWAAENIHCACSLLTFREIDEAGLRQALERPCPEEACPSVVYSVDLTYRFLPDLLRLARAASPNDPLVGTCANGRKCGRCLRWEFRILTAMAPSLLSTIVVCGSCMSIES